MNPAIVPQTFVKETDFIQFDGSFAAASAVAAWFGTTWRMEDPDVHPQENGYKVDGPILLGIMGHDNNLVRVAPGEWVLKNLAGRPHVLSDETFKANYRFAVAPETHIRSYTREVLDHRVEGKGGGADDTRILVLDEPGQGGANHEYAVTDGAGKVLLRVSFQNGPIQECGLNGAQQEHLLAIVIDRLRSFQAGPFGNRYNAIALTESESVLMWLQRRTVDRVRRGVEGFNKA